MEKRSIEPDLHIRFSGDFAVVQVEGEIEDPSSFGLTLMTALRSAQKGSDPLALGPAKTLRGRDATKGFHLHLDESGHSLKRFSGVTGWSEVDSSAPGNQPGFPVAPAPEDIPAWIDQLPSLRWRGLRSQTDDAWHHIFQDDSLDQSAIPGFGASILQLDLLLRSLDLPRRELQIVFADSILHMTVNNDRDFLMALTRAPLLAHEQVTLNRCMDFFAWPL
ncbi:MAG: hypothetical protein ACQKBV_14155 [Puniceicoccales bacterium]